MTTAETILAKSALARSGAEADAYAAGVEDGSQRAREEQLGILLWGLLMGAGTVAAIVGIIHVLT